VRRTVRHSEESDERTDVSCAPRGARPMTTITTDDAVRGATTDPDDDDELPARGFPEFLRRHQRVLLGLLGAALVLASWQICADTGVVNSAFSSSPWEILKAFRSYFTAEGGGWNALRISAIEFSLGFLLSLVAGLLLGFAMGWFRWFEYLVDPLVNFGYAAPRIALVPLLVIWFGIGTESKVAVVFLSSIFPIIINTMSGVKIADASLVRVARSFKASRLQLFRTVVIPGAVPSIVTGVRLGIGQGLIGMVVGELLASTAGLGYTIETAGNNLQSPTMFVAVFLVSGIGVILSQAMRAVERRLERWRPGVGQ
jgi:NitT/TauT family transport system permease protein